MIEHVSNSDMDTRKIKKNTIIYGILIKKIQAHRPFVLLRNYLVPICNIIFLVISSKGPMSCMGRCTTKPNKKFMILIRIILMLYFLLLVCNEITTPCTSKFIDRYNLSHEMQFMFCIKEGDEFWKNPEPLEIFSLWD